MVYTVTGAEIGRPPVYRITTVQLVVLVVMSGSLLIVDKTWALSVLSGGLIAVLPQAYFATMAFRWRGARSARAIANASYAGVVGKFMFSAAGFAVVFAVIRPISGPAVFSAYLSMLAIQIIGSGLLLRSSDSKTEKK